MKPLALLLAVASLSACALDGDEDEDDLVDTQSDALSRQTKPGVNGHFCVASPYNCRFHEGSSRVVTQGGEESWGIATGYSIRDGNGEVLGTQTGSRLTFNYGQTRLLAGKAHALALTTSNGSAGWYPIDAILGEASFRKQNGEVNAKDPGRGRMACYRVRDSSDPSIELKKVVYDSKEGIDGHERAGDYLPLARNNGRRSVNLVFSVPGFGLGGATTDHFLSGETFHRVSVPTDSGLPSISIPLWVRDGAGHFRKRSGSLRFLYGFIVASDGVKRYGWMAEPALMPIGDC
ncbi:MAG: hypothetical protein HOV81_15015 [Kofleriaceae bacterium]|nr:hypothetical protein [Kofleriaceae bacterium]